MENTNLSYIGKIDKTSIKIHEEILQGYKEKISNIVSLKNEIPIFLDTNVLLKSYSISFEARESLLKFYKEYHKRIFLSNQVQIEFTKNREDIIERFFEDVTKGLPSSFNTDILNHFKAFLEKNKTILVDYKDFEKNLSKIELELIKLGKTLCAEIENKKNENSDLLLNDSFLKVFSECNCLSATDELIKKATDEFDILRKNLNTDKLDSELKKLGKVFPGMGDIKQKPDNPYGDFIIYYELMEFASKNKTDVIFLTYDTSKGDWMKFNKNPHTHYLENFFLNTGHLIYILDAQRVFEESLKIKFTSLIDLLPQQSSNYDSEINPDNLKEFLYNKFPAAEKDHKTSFKDLSNELIYNGFQNLEMVESILNKANNAFLRYIKDEENGINKYNMIGNLRMRLRLFNNDYFLIDKETGNYKKTTLRNMEKYKHLLD